MQENDILKRISDYTLEEIMGDRFAKYAKTIIQDRAIPDVRDGLKPVQRRILYTMYKTKNTFDHNYRKSGETVGEVMGKYHPHGDSSIYDAMVRMSQWWKQNTIYIDMHGNNGSMDGDSAAAYRYTEAKLSKISNELLKDLEKETVNWAPNYADTLLEPTVLPAKFPNLLVNGANGISAGYATNIPPHNLGEVIDATIKRIDHPHSTLEEIMELIPGPDFPTGGIVEGKKGIEEAFEKGRGRIMVRSKTTLEKAKGKDQIIVTEIPYDVNKAVLVKHMDEIRIDKKIDGILEVRDESDRENPVRIVIDLKKEADSDLVLNYLFKNTELQISYNYNMVAIVRRRPMTLGILAVLDAYIDHQKEVVTRRTKFDYIHAQERFHIVEGLVKALSILDEVIATIRASKNRADAIDQLVKAYQFSEEQAKAIVDLQLYRLTNTDVTLLEEELRNLTLIMKGLLEILNDLEKLKAIIKEELRKIKKEYATPRITVIKEEITEIKIDTVKMIPKEDCIVVVTKEGYVKRVSLRSYQANEEETMVKEGDYLIGQYQMNTLDTLLLFTNLGNYLYVPVYEIPDLKWKELGKHISNLIAIKPEETIIGSVPVMQFEEEVTILLFSKEGMVKRTKLSDFKVQRYSKPIVAMKLKGSDQVVSLSKEIGKEVFIVTENGYGLWYDLEEIGTTGLKTAGVKAISLKNDFVARGMVCPSDFEFVTIFTDKSTGKRIRKGEFEKTSRARKGVLVVRDVKTNPYHILEAFVETGKNSYGYITRNGIDYLKTTELSIVDRYSTGTVFTKEKVTQVFLKTTLSSHKEEAVIEEEKEPISLTAVDEKIMTIDDFLDDFKIE